MTQFAPDGAVLDELYMARALELAGRGWGCVHPNPLVGAVVVRDGEVVGEGWHAEYGGPHAEVAALAEAGPAARGATLYVTLEPCNHHGKTPPCSEAVIAAGVARVVYAAADPSREAGGGGNRLREAGIEVVGDVAREMAREQNRAFFHFVEHGTPYLVLKYATSLDGCIARRTGEATPVSGPESRAEVQRLRAGFDAIMVGAGTARSDDPLLTVRGEVVPRVAPKRVVVDPEAGVAADSRLMRTLAEAPVWVVCALDAPAERRERLERVGARVLEAERCVDGLEPRSVVGTLAAAGVRSILCEGGARLGAALLRAGCVQRMILFQAPIIFGDAGVRAFPGFETAPGDWKILRSDRFGADLCMTLEPGGVE